MSIKNLMYYNSLKLFLYAQIPDLDNENTLVPLMVWEHCLTFSHKRVFYFFAHICDQLFLK